MMTLGWRAARPTSSWVCIAAMLQKSKGISEFSSLVGRQVGGQTNVYRMAVDGLRAGNYERVEGIRKR